MIEVQKKVVSSISDRLILGWVPKGVPNFYFFNYNIFCPFFQFLRLNKLIN